VESSARAAMKMRKFADFLGKGCSQPLAKLALMAPVGYKIASDSEQRS
jgi:hypothetical protein